MTPSSSATSRLKVLPPDTATDPERRQRFEREARAVAALNHPSIVTIHSVDEVDGRLFLTMELVDGQPLSELIRPGGLPLAQLLAIATPLADAVSAAHARGITHRDLKPANVMVTPTRQVKVLDFGLAKLLDTGVVTDTMATGAARRDHGAGQHPRHHRLHGAGAGRRASRWTRGPTSSRWA